ncbi:OLC1v1025512C3 [Oldenlandia corymbosa var. corymbosa]|uniref:OLC1v1025512C3 n=1 Tax=Oldenlandia corymbosa var. corymbosa TaxID=529605 RepID=A0AAV1C501_OLDCO|nr:OLC1v1025512C3 [Oldenlandia corymbosa var. corymbosa]
MVPGRLHFDQFLVDFADNRSRICVKNLPKYVAEDRLREFFSQKGEVTDAKLMRTRDGKSRQFGFVGFRSEEEANEAIRFFHKSFMDTCRITCEIARKVGDPEIPRPWSRYSKEKEEKPSEQGNDLPDSEILKPKKSKKEKKKDDKSDDPQLEEFLQVMQPRSKTKLWANDTLTATTAAVRRGDVAERSNVKREDEKSNNNMVLELNKDNKEEQASSESSDKRQDLVHDEVISDMDYFKSRVKQAWSDSEGEDEGESDKDADSDDGGNNFADMETDGMHDAKGKDDVSLEKSKYESLEEPDKEELDKEPSLTREYGKEALETGRLFVRNLPYTTTEEELEEYFRTCGSVSQVHIVVDKETKRSRGIAYVQYVLPESASRALEELDNSIFQGRLLHVMVAKQNNPSGTENNTSDQLPSKTLKQKKLDAKKASEATGNTRSWNSLFMRPDTIVENIARRFGISKSDLLDKEADDLAVRIALGETQVIEETKKALRNAGVNVASLEDFAAGKTEGMKRSNHVILVKNLSYGSTETDLANMFGKFGSLEKIILPPSKTLAVVVFLEAAEARAAFRGLAYKRYKDAPLYLEWAPGSILSPNPSSVDNSDDVAVGQHDLKRVLLEEQTRTADEDVDPDRVESRSLYVKNLNFKTSDESLRKHFADQMKQGKLLSVRVKKHLKNGKHVSMGFGFIEFDSVDTATSLCRDLQGTVLDGHALILQLCHGKKDEKVTKKAEDDRSSTKLIVRNVAFEATEKELRQLFSPFGQVKSLRLPMRFGNHRGFAFVEYVTKQEAKNALQALSNTHLYGRHLVLERAKEGESLEELRARTAAQFDEHGSTKYSKKRKHMAVLDEGSFKFERIAD